MVQDDDEGRLPGGRRDFMIAGAASLAAVTAGASSLTAAAAAESPGAPNAGLHGTVKALVFDVFGTVVDWRGSIIREGEWLGKRKGIDADWVAFADGWRGGYQPAMKKVRSGEIAWTNIDGLNRLILNDLLRQFNIDGLSEAEIDHFNRAWHRLWPWPDSVGGLQRLKSRYIISTLSNGNVSLLTDMGKYAGLPWDCILSAELFGHYKPDPEVYLGAAKLLGPDPSQIMMAAAHMDDLLAAKKLGLRTALITRPLEFGGKRKADTAEDAQGKVDIVASDFMDLAAKMGT
ncbi:MAG: haloacid dehalogenase type II [Betaproteobacteria bacterium]